MALFKNLFKRKEGGTFFGNLVRGASNFLPFGLGGVYNSVNPVKMDEPLLSSANRGAAASLGPAVVGGTTPGMLSNGTYNGGNLPTAHVVASRIATPQDVVKKWEIFGMSLPLWSKWPVIAAAAFGVYSYVLPTIMPKKGRRTNRRR